jgi:hypothetical protein
VDVRHARQRHRVEPAAHPVAVLEERDVLLGVALLEAPRRVGAGDAGPHDGDVHVEVDVRCVERFQLLVHQGIGH